MNEQGLAQIPLSGFAAQHLLDVESLSRTDIEAILDRAEFYEKLLTARQPVEKVLEGKIVLTLFFEPSTRTRISFEMAAKRLGADVVNWDFERSSMAGKGESLKDTIRTLDAVQPDALVIRHSEQGAAFLAAEHASLSRAPVINAGDGIRAHPTQALLDALAMRQAKGPLEDLTVAIVGDISHSRVARSNIALLAKMGATIRLIGPRSLMPTSFPGAKVEIYHDLGQGLPGADIVMCLRIQRERMAVGELPEESEYHRRFGMTRAWMDVAGSGALVMHPGPMNRGIEIAEDLPDDPDRSLILEQVRLGVPVRMAVLDLLLGGRGRV